MSRLTLNNYLQYRAAEQGTGTVDDLVVKGNYKDYPLYLNFYLKDILNVYPAAGSVHIAENFPRFYNDSELYKDFHLYRKGVLPVRPDNKRAMTEKLQKTLNEHATPPETAHRSREMLCDCLAGLLAGENRRIIATLPNTGQIGNLPQDVSVETWATVNASGITPEISGNIPMSCYGFMASVVAEQELTVQAALTQDRDLVKQALFSSPLFHEKEKVNDLLEAMFEAEKPWINW